MVHKILSRIILALCMVFFTFSSFPNHASAQTRQNVTCSDPQQCYKIYLPILELNSNHLAGSGIKICLVTDTGGINDKSFNAGAWKGILDAQTQLGTSGAYLESHQEADYQTNINAFLQEKCNLILTIGFSLGDATKTAADANPTQKFAIVDFSYDSAINNVMSLTFVSNQSSFLAGYLAAGTTQTGKVGTYGGFQIPTVTAFMDGFYYGVQYYNQQKAKSVQVLGWNPVLKVGLFSGTFSDQNVGISYGQTLLVAGADVILPVAGLSGLGTATAILAHGNAWVIGVDTDWAITDPIYQGITLTSMMKNIDVLVYNAINKLVYGNFLGGDNLGTLANNGVGLGTIASSVPASLKTELDQVKAGIIAGTIHVGP